MIIEEDPEDLPVITSTSKKQQAKQEYGSLGGQGESSSDPSGPRIPLFTCFKLTLLIVLIIINTIEFWHRMLLFNVSATPTPGCTKTCRDTAIFPTCMECPFDDEAVHEACAKCRFCRKTHGSDYYNPLDAACISTKKYAFLGGIGFTFTFAFSGLTVDWLAHHLGHSTIHITSVLFWSASIVGLGLSHNFSEMLTSRAILGLAQGLNAPCCFTLISSFFPEQHHPLANGLFSMGAFLGMGTSSLSIDVALKVGWRATCIVAGLVGMGIGLIYAFLLQQGKVQWASSRMKGSRPRIPSNGQEAMDEEARAVLAAKQDEWYDGQHPHSPPPRCELFQNLGEVIRFYPMQILCLASACRVVGTRSLSAYLPLFYQRAYAKHMKRFSFLNGIGWSLCGSFSSAFGGWITGRLATHSPSALAFIPAIGVISSLLPLAVVVSYYANFNLSYGALLLHYLLSECWIGPVMAILQRLVRIEIQGTAVAMLLTVNALTSSTGLMILGYVDDGTAEIAWPFLAIMTAAYVGAAVLLCLLGFQIRRQGLYRQVHS